MRIAVVTTFSHKGYEVYGKQFIASFKAHWPSNVQLFVFYETGTPMQTEGAIWRCLDLDADRRAFMERHKDPDVNDYRKWPVRYCHKVFAMTAVPRETYDHIIWLDADCVTTRDVTEEMLLTVMAEPGKAGSYLGRPYHTHTETGFIHFNLLAGGDVALDEMRRMYVTDEMMNLPELHDCMVFDYVRRKMERAGYRWRNICPNARGLEVFEQSPLKEFIRHNKGPKRKLKEYGDSMVPESNQGEAA